MSENNGVSMVICCYNSSARLPETLEHLKKIKTTIPWEIIVVDNCSDDHTGEKALSVWNNHSSAKLTVVTENNRGLMYARIKGVTHSSYDIISFIDDDNWVDSQWIDKVYAILKKDNSLAACGGSTVAVFETIEPAWFSDFAISYAVGKQQQATGYVSEEKGYLWGAGLTVRKKAWNNLFDSGFKSMLKGRTGKSLNAGEDSEMCFAWMILGWKLWYDESLKLKHFIPAFRLSTTYLEKIYSGFGKAEVVLSIYRGLISGRRNNKPSWFLQCFAALKKLCLSGIKSLFSSGKNKVRDKVILNHDEAYFFELLFSKKNTRKFIPRLISLKITIKLIDQSYNT
jgi:glycosyltransferase involved in cell wall biosynthesis